MLKIKQLLEKKRNHLEFLIQKKHGNLSDSEIVAISQELDVIINMYNKSIQKSSAKAN